MMTNLFSSFDPSSSLIFNFHLNWISSTLSLIFIPFLYWFSNSRWATLWSKICGILHSEFKTLMGFTNPGGTIFMVTLFTIIAFNNSLGLLPYIFTSTSHLAVTLALALPLWISFMIYGWLNRTKLMFAHLVPMGTPGPLMPFMVLIETVSNIIRPGTLAVRLAANMIAGHLLLTLLGSTGPSLSQTLLYLLLSSQILLLTLESAVAVIQSYVFAVLTALYASEVN
uniref:ATP synthase subunit a n=1 Tax=Lysmata boggessi TaxID=497604 RepID=A0A8F5H678_9EUCA|nr:ATP synthase F0 subunit 6 [Lysmata boggessi]QVT15578.1 ATP synthase F0 subunit 6 [Lysmata boggessi]QXJ42670.1 ATP synthase F0 subunit 6 [Lysmata boggessi]